MKYLPDLLGRPHVRRPAEAGPLSLRAVNGQLTLTDERGRPIQLRGMSTHGLQWYGEIINPNAFAALARDWECNVIRLALYIGEDGFASRPELKALVYKGIDLALANDLYVIVDWHVLSPGDPNAAIYNGAADFFTELADHYRSHPQYFQILWELCNEPNPNPAGGPGVSNDAAGWEAVKRYAKPLITALRERGDNIILVGTPNWSQRVDLAADEPIEGENIMYTVHFYSGTHLPSADSTDRTNVMANTRYALAKGVAIFVSEWGTSEASGNNGPYLKAADEWLAYLNAEGISWCNWSLTTRAETSGAFRPATADLLDPGDGQVWKQEQVSESGSYVRARIKGIAAYVAQEGGVKNA